MATKLAKLSELKVAGLKRELEGRGLDTSGTKPLHQQSLRDEVYVPFSKPMFDKRTLFFVYQYNL